MLAIGLSGGIATGKSTCCQIMKSLLSEMVVFDADACVAELYHDSAVIERIAAHFGAEVLDAEGGLDKSVLRSWVVKEKGAKEFLEGVFHPRVREECLALLAETATNSVSRLFVADIPLLFESGFDFGHAATLLVATSRNTQFARLKARNGWDDVTVRGFLRSQMPIESKLDLADVVFWNEGGVDVLQAQCRRYLMTLDLI